MPALEAACFPLVPLGNRVAGNRFVRPDGVAHLLRPHAGEAHHLHGDGWLGVWELRRQTGRAVTLSLTHSAGGSGHAYRATQTFELRRGARHLGLQTADAGPGALPFGLGRHPQFALAADTTLLAPAASMDEKVQEHLPGAPVKVLPDLDFSRPQPLPPRLCVVESPAPTLSILFQTDHARP